MVQSIPDPEIYKKIYSWLNKYYHLLILYQICYTINICSNKATSTIENGVIFLNIEEELGYATL